MNVHVPYPLQPTYQELIQSEGMVEHLVRGLKTENGDLQKHCAAAIFKVSTCTYTILTSFAGFPQVKRKGGAW